MKKILFILIILTTYSCSSIRFDYSYLNYSSSEIDKKFNESQRNNWHNLDLNYDSIPGMSVERAYNELLKGRKAKKVIVAVIDAGIDINHEDIKDVVWVNKDEIPDPDLIIRTGGEYRLSNFLIWQSAYSEFYTSEVLWPDFTMSDFFDALKSYSMRSRRFGIN